MAKTLFKAGKIFDGEEFFDSADTSTIPFGVTYAVDACTENTVISNLDSLCVQTAVFIPMMLKGDSLDYEKMQQKP